MQQKGRNRELEGGGEESRGDGDTEREGGERESAKERKIMSGISRSWKYCRYCIKTLNLSSLMLKALALTLWRILQRLVGYSRGALRNLPVTNKTGTVPSSGDSEERANRYSCESCQREHNLNTDVMRGDDTVSSITGLPQCRKK